MPDPATFPLLRRRLLAWFDRNRRDLPWRRDRDPYRIWVSEVMLQQTTVATVKSRFEQFIAMFPSLEELAAADEQDVLRAWEGLGYYRRARNLHAAARHLVAEHGGEFLDDPAVWAALPGVGRYITGAVLSQAFDRRVPIVEANSQRVLCRLFGEARDPASGPVRKWLWDTAAALLPARRAGDFNQALMELGALVCTPSQPRCGQCPIANHCVAFRDGSQDRIPLKTVAPAAVDVREVAVLVRRRGRVLLVRRPENGRWSNMWEFPHGELRRNESPEAGAERALAELTGLTADIGPELMTVRHVVMHFRITMTCLEAQQRGGKFHSSFYVEARWLSPARLAEFPVSSPQRKLTKELSRAVRQRRLF
jgi:A/G-specific adenine glycosylase